jgi:hypothetical protein
VLKILRQGGVHTLPVKEMCIKISFVKEGKLQAGKPLQKSKSVYNESISHEMHTKPNPVNAFYSFTFPSFNKEGWPQPIDYY